MKQIFWILLFISFPIYAQTEEKKVVIKDVGDKELSKVDHKKICESVLEDEIKNFTSETEVKGKVVLVESSALEIFKANNEFAFGAKCIIKFPSKK